MENLTAVYWGLGHISHAENKPLPPTPVPAWDQLSQLRRAVSSINQTRGGREPGAGSPRASGGPKGAGGLPPSPPLRGRLGEAPAGPPGCSPCSPLAPAPRGDGAGLAPQPSGGRPGSPRLPRPQLPLFRGTCRPLGAAGPGTAPFPGSALPAAQPSMAPLSRVPWGTLAWEPPPPMSPPDPVQVPLLAVLPCTALGGHRGGGGSHGGGDSHGAGGRHGIGGSCGDGGSHGDGGIVVDPAEGKAQKQQRQPRPTARALVAAAQGWQRHPHPVAWHGVDRVRAPVALVGPKLSAGPGDVGTARLAPCGSQWSPGVHPWGEPGWSRWLQRHRAAAGAGPGPSRGPHVPPTLPHAGVAGRHRPIRKIRFIFQAAARAQPAPAGP